MRKGQIDIAIEPFSALIDGRLLESTLLAIEDAYVVVGQDHPLAKRKAIALKELAEITFTSIRPNLEHAVRKHLQSLCRKLGLLGDLPKTLYAENVDAYEELFLHGLGENAILLPQSIALRFAGVADTLANAGADYVAIPLVGEGTAYKMTAFYSHDLRPSVQLFLDNLRAASTLE